MPTFSATPLAAAIVAVFCFALLSRFVFADITNSTSFKTNQSINEFGGGATSTSFQSVTTGGQIVTGQSTSTNFLISTGYQYFDSFSPMQANWRWFDDELNETPSNALESENVAPPGIFNDNIIKLRVTVRETADYGQAGTKFRLQYSTSSDFSSGAYALIEQYGCSSTSAWCYANGGGVDNDVITTSTLSDADSCSGSIGDGCGTHNESGTSTSAFTHKKSASTEYEFAIISKNTISNTVYFFRLFDVVASSSVPLDSGKTNPSLTTQGGTLSFSISGLPSSSSAGGVITNIDTTSTEVSFGNLPIGTPLTGAQRLNVSTNSTAGFEIFTYQSQGFVGDGGQEIDPVAGTNSSPASWTSGCSTSVAGCFGYHTSAPVLAGGSTRFAADDTYAGFSQNPDEVAYSATPVDDHETDVVYKIEAHDLQSAGEYRTNVTYIVVPVY